MEGVRLLLELPGVQHPLLLEVILYLLRAVRAALLEHHLALVAVLVELVVVPVHLVLQVKMGLLLVVLTLI